MEMAIRKNTPSTRNDHILHFPYIVTIKSVYYNLRTAHNENLLISGKRWAEYWTLSLTNLLRGAQGRKPSCISDYYKTYCTSALFWDKPNVQHDSQITYFQAVENKSAPRSKFVEMTWDNILLMILHNILLITCQDQEFALIIYPDSTTSVWASVLPYRTACSLKPYLAVCNWLF